MYTPGEIAENYIQIGKKKAVMNTDKMFLLAVMAGIYIAVAGCGASTAAGTIGGSAGKLIGASVFPAGLTLVLLAGSELFTGNCLLIIPVLEREISVGAMLRNWGIVYLGNFVGSILVAWMVVNSHQLSLFDGQLAVAAGNSEGVDAICRCLDQGDSLQSAGLPSCLGELCGKGCDWQDNRVILSDSGICGLWF